MAMAFMERRARYRNSLLLCILVLGCRTGSEEEKIIPHRMVLATDPSLQQSAGFLLYRNERFSGRLYRLYPNGDTAFLIPYYKGKEEGWLRKWFENGQEMEERFFASGKKEGLHRAWWPDGTLRFAYQFSNDEHEGEAREWFRNGKPERYFHYTKGFEDGRQQMWWEDGSVRANYVVKEGEQYGLIGRKLCKNSADEKN